MSIESVKRKSKVKEAVIESKDQRWHTRNRITLTFGSNDVEQLATYLYDKEGKVQFQEVDFHQAKSKAIEEILDNSIDEFYRHHVSQIHVTLSADKKTVTVEDNGIGFPVDKIKDVYSEYRTGSKFRDEEVDEKGFLHRTLGQNGLGAAATCLTADYFKATVKHHNSKKTKTVEFIDGALKIKPSATKPFKGHSGVKIEVTLSPEVYKDNIIDEELLKKRIIDLSLTNPGLTFYFNGVKYLSKKGLSELASLVNESTGQIIGEGAYIHDVVTATKKQKVKAKYDITFAFAFDEKSYDKEKFISFVNSTPTYDGGFHHDRAKRIFINAVKEKLTRAANKEKIELIDADITNGVVFILGVVMPNPRFESQTKRKLVKDYNLEKSLDLLVNENIDKFFRKNSTYLDLIIDRAKSRQRSDELKEAAKLHKKSSKKIEKLLDANERKDRSKCTLFICEGDSAIGGLRSARDKNYHAGIALKGKPMNVMQSTIKDVLNNKEFTDIMTSVGLVIGQKANPEEMRFSKIVFLADSDVDGGHINTLLTNFFFFYWPELFEMGMVQVTKAPLFEVITSSGKKLFAETPEELTQIQADKRITVKEIMRNKGLGEMSEEAFKHVLNKPYFTRISIKDDKNAKEMLDICFGKESQARKDLLLSKNINSKTTTTKSKKG